MMDQWYKTDGEADIATPALLIYPDRIEDNIRLMIRIAGDTAKLRPHVKTHKMSEVVKLKLRMGITKFKCSTIAEAEMIARCGGNDIMLAMQPVGPQIERFFNLQKIYTGSRFSTLVDNDMIIEQLVAKAKENCATINLWLDINNGMDRTGVEPGEDALQLYIKISSLPNLHPCGLHVYDGHIHDSGLARRREICERDYEPVASLIRSINNIGIQVPVVVAGGTPTFPIHARRNNTEASPGTCVLWDQGYQQYFPDLRFQPAAVLISRIISKPGRNLLCLDLGHKAVAAEMPHPRITFAGIKVDRFVSHHEEHMVIESPEAEYWNPGDVLYGIPWHICPTVPRYSSALVIRNGHISGTWPVNARDRMITV